jgi:hypothetical protein
MAMTLRQEVVSGRIRRTLGGSTALLALWLAAPFARAAPPPKDLGPVREGSAFEYCRYKVIGSGGQQCQPPLMPDQVICLPCEHSEHGQSSCLAAGTQATVLVVSQDGRQALCPLALESLGGTCGACGPGERSFTTDPTDIGSFVIDNREIGAGETFCVYSVTKMLVSPKDPDARERRVNCAVHANQTVCLPCPVGGGCQIAGIQSTANLNINNDRKGCQVLLESKGGTCATCPDGSVLFKTP